MVCESGTAIVVKTSLGWIGIARTEDGLRRSTLPQPTKAVALAQLGPGWRMIGERDDDLLSSAADLLRRYSRGEPVWFDLPLDLSGVPDFTRRVLLVCRSIALGETCTYADLARALGRARAARAVGQALRRNPLPLIIPCHRVIGSDGSLVGFAGGERALDMKAALLAREQGRRAIKGSGSVSGEPRQCAWTLRMGLPPTAAR